MLFGENQVSQQREDLPLRVCQFGIQATPLCCQDISALPVAILLYPIVADVHGGGTRFPNRGAVQ